ncbi:MAG: DNA polymerase III subunit delta' [Thiothrix nivea]|nr:MAG: DNA polymerase III subunit delta' [Thiothrix nivea]
MMYPWHYSIWASLQQARADNRLPHALLFSGDKGCGHEAFMQTIAQNLLCLSPDPVNGQACGECRSCQVFTANAHPDFTRIAAPVDKQVISVDQIRALNHFLELSCSYSPVRVALILEAEKMNVNAANSLLKSLEEPAEHTHILLFSTQASGLLPTIRSRCQQLRLPLPETPLSVRWLDEQHPVQESAVLLRLAGGKPLHALELDSGELIAARKIWLQHLLAVLQQEKSIAEVGSEWSNQPREQLLNWQLETLQELIRYKLGVSPAGQQEIRTLATRLAGKNLWDLYDQLLELKQLATHPLNQRLFAENMLSLWLK